MTMARIVNISKWIHFRQMREFQSAGPSSTLNSARGSTHGSLGSNLHQVERMVVVVIKMTTMILVIMMIVIAGWHQLWGFLSGWLHSELFPLKFSLSSNFLSYSPFPPSAAGRLVQLMSTWVIVMQMYKKCGKLEGWNGIKSRVISISPCEHI